MKLLKTSWDDLYFNLALDFCQEPKDMEQMTSLMSVLKGKFIEKNSTRKLYNILNWTKIKIQCIKMCEMLTTWNSYISKKKKDGIKSVIHASTLTGRPK